MTDKPSDPETLAAMREAAKILGTMASTDLSPSAQCGALTFALATIIAGHPGPEPEYQDFLSASVASVRSMTDEIRAAFAAAKLATATTPPRADGPPDPTGDKPTRIVADLSGPPGPGNDIRRFDLEIGAPPWGATDDEMGRIPDFLLSLSRTLLAERPAMRVMATGIALAVAFRVNHHLIDDPSPDRLLTWLRSMIENSMAAPLSGPQSMH